MLKNEEPALCSSRDGDFDGKFYSHDPLTTKSDEETILQDILVILKRPLRN